MKKALVLLLCLTGCGEVPQPFRHEGNAEALARPHLVRSVTIGPPEDSESGRAMAKALVTALEQREIPSSIRDPLPGTERLGGVMSEIGGLVQIEWTLTGADGLPRGTTTQTVPAGLWQAAQAAGFRSLAEQTIAAVMPEGSRPDFAAAPPPTTGPDRRPTVRLSPLPELPGDGRAALAKALKNSLERNGLLVVSTGGDYVVDGQISIDSSPPREDLLKISWVVTGPDGIKLGTIDQNGPVPKGRLSEPWGGLGREIAEGGAIGVAQLVDTIKRRP